VNVQRRPNYVHFQDISSDISFFVYRRRHFGSLWLYLNCLATSSGTFSIRQRHFTHLPRTHRHFHTAAGPWHSTDVTLAWGEAVVQRTLLESKHHHSSINRSRSSVSHLSSQPHTTPPTLSALTFIRTVDRSPCSDTAPITPLQPPVVTVAWASSVRTGIALRAATRPVSTAMTLLCDDVANVPSSSCQPEHY
jgi:hypothetical protein